MCAQKLVLVVGANRLQNELVCAYIVAHAGGEYAAQNAPTLHQAACGAAGDGKLILYDCLDKGAAEGAESLACGIPGTVRGAHMALFNLRSGSGAEKAAIRNGVRGFFYLHDPPETLVKGIRAIFNNEVWASRHTIAVCLQDSVERCQATSTPATALTRREADILTCLVKGATNETIAAECHISHHTVKTHLYNIYKKIGVSSRLQAARWAQQHR